MNFLLPFFRCVALVCLLFCISAIRLHSQTIRHTVEKGETLYRISRNYGVTVQAIVNQNPGLTAENLQAGQSILVPTDAKDAQQPSAQTLPADTFIEYTVKKKDTAYSIAKAHGLTVEMLVEANPQLDSSDYKLKKGQTLRIPVRQKVEAKEISGLNLIRVAVVLPFSGSELENKRSVEFYRGFLMGVEVLKKHGISLTIRTYAEPKADVAVSTTMTQVMAERPDIIIGPVYPSHFEKVAACASDSTFVVIPFSSKVPQLASKPNLFVLNAPDEYSRTVGVDLFLNHFAKSSNIVFLHTAHSENADFLGELRRRLVVAGYETTELAAHYTAQQMKEALASKAQTNFVFVPDGASEELLANLLPKLAEIRNLLPGKSLSLFGFEGWLPFAAGKYREEMHSADTYILTPTYFYPYTSASMAFTSEYRKWFNTELLEATPRMAPLGYDLALGMLGGMNSFGYDYGTQTPSVGTVAATPKLQSDLRFMVAGESGGYVNRSMWLVHFKTDKSIVKIQNP